MHENRIGLNKFGGNKMEKSLEIYYTFAMSAFLLGSMSHIQKLIHLIPFES
jgi:hypothetical protein